MCRCGKQAQAPDSSGRFRRVLQGQVWVAGAGCGRFPKAVPGEVLQGSRGFRNVSESSAGYMTLQRIRSCCWGYHRSFTFSCGHLQELADDMDVDLKLIM